MTEFKGTVASRLIAAHSLALSNTALKTKSHRLLSFNCGC